MEVGTFFSFFCAVFVITSAYVPRVLNGRPRGGFLGHPRVAVSALPPAQWFTQKLDQFNETDIRYWQQRYFVNDTFFNNTVGGPLFVQIGGEGPQDPTWAVEGNWIRYAQQFKALCLAVEHRFYGQSHPTPDLSVDNLSFLSSEQALSDLAAIITYFKNKYNVTTTIVFGGSYPGSLAAWFRSLYPNVADAAVSSSAPLVAKLDFYEFAEVATQAFTNFDPTKSCVNNIHEATGMMYSQLDSEAGRTLLKNLFRLCDDVPDDSKSKDVQNLFATVAANVMEIVQYNKDNRAFEGALGTNITIDTVCNMMNDEKLGLPMMRYAQISNMLLKVYSEKCLDFKYDDMIASLKATEWNNETSEGSRQWTYQTCNEFGFYQTSDSSGQPFGNSFPLQFWIDQCTDIFGPDFNKATLQKDILKTNAVYKGLNITLSKAVFYNGAIDPWHALGITTQTKLEDTHTFFLNDTAHCAIMYPPSPRDTPDLLDARTKIGEIIKGWVGQK